MKYMELTDTHCHIHDAQLELPGDEASRVRWQRAGRADPDAMIAEAARYGVNRMVCVGTNAEDSQMAVDFARDRWQCWASVGLHPHEAKEGRLALAKLRALLKREGERVEASTKAQKIIAIGECGLDYFYENSPRKDQEEALRYQIELALEYGLPLIFHVRGAFDDFWPVFDSYQGVRGVLHSFTDSMTHLDQALKRGLYIGVNGIMTFTKDQAQLEMARRIPLDAMVLETDAPFLTPHPLRGKVNEPARVLLVAEFMARLRGLPSTEVASHTTANAQRLFLF